MNRIAVVIVALFCLCGALHAGTADRLNFLFIVGEDLGPQLGCYGDKNAITPNIDKLASEGALFTRAFTHSPVCAPSRSGLITAQYPTTIGTHHMRSTLLAPPPTFTSLLRKAGYFVAWPGKTDFNFAVPADAFDSTKKWTDREAGKPFFAYINISETHESQIRSDAKRYAENTRRLKPEQRHDPAKMVLPPYYPDTPEVRKDIAHYYDLATAIDYTVGDVLEELEKRGEAQNTVVIFFGDHGWGMPRGKRWVYDSGIRVPLIVRWPGKIQPGSVREDLVSFIDLGATVLSLAGVERNPAMNGNVFLGPAAQQRKYVYAHRDRMDETFDRIRAVRDNRFKYIRNFEPQLPYAQRIAYMDEMPTMKVWRQLNDEKKLSGAQALFFAPSKPREELYDLDADPHEINNIAALPEHSVKLQELSKALDAWIAESKDLGQYPETELIARGLVKNVLDQYAKRKEPGYKVEQK
ncbi:MAG TPA: sulfatase [Planctomycetota bacterium]|nr:sulfatase [Planctomycetota bacterium]